MRSKRRHDGRFRRAPSCLIDGARLALQGVSTRPVSSDNSHSPKGRMRIHVDNPGLIDELASYLSGCRCELQEIRPTSLEASPPAAATDSRLARLQIDGFLRTWKARHPGTTVSVRDDGKQSRLLPDRTESVSAGIPLETPEGIR